LLCANQAADMLLDIPDTLQISTHVLSGRVAGLSRKSNMDTCSNPTGSGVNHVAINLTLFYVPVIMLTCCRHIRTHHVGST
jgi:hypothetical protein